MSSGFKEGCWKKIENYDFEIHIRRVLRKPGNKEEVLVILMA